mgnify:CR=1 FL=1
MRNILYLLTVTTIFILPLSCSKDSHELEDGIKTCSFNIRFDNPNDGFNQWDNRRKNVVIFLGIEKPDIIGFQEVLSNQLEYLEMRLTGYSRVGVGRDDGIDQGEFAPILYLDERFMLLDSGNFWLSETPAVPSIGWDALINRICTWVILEDQLSGEEIHVYNTHFSHVGSEARLKSAELIMDSIAVKSNDARVILTGDFNTEPGSSPYNEIIENGLEDSYDSDLRLGPEGTYNGFTLTGTYDRRIDYIFFRGFVPEYYVTNSMVIDNQYLSDHFPVIAMLEYKSGE